MSKKEQNETPLEEELQNFIPNEEASKTEEKAEEKTETELLTEELAALNDRYFRTLAEYDNYRKRSAKERESIYPEAKANTVSEFLSIVDNFSRAIEFECSDTEFKKGMEMIYSSFEEVFAKLGVEKIGVVGELFNPEIHNAVMHVEDEEITVSTVVEVFQQGYKLGEKILRYAMVKVAN